MKVQFFLILNILFINIFYSGNFEEFLIFKLKIDEKKFIFKLHKDDVKLNRVYEINNDFESNELNRGTNF